MSEELISIIVPVYNGDVYLAECIESVRQQTYNGFELLLIDDGSTDRSPAICDEYAASDARIHVIRKRNGGVSSAWNTGLDHATGQYIMFLDADDRLTPDCLAVLHAGLLKHNADIASGSVVNSIYPWRSYTDHELWIGTQGLEQSLKDDPNCYAAWAKLYRAEIIGNTRFHEEYRINEDTLFVFELLCKRPSFVILRHDVYCYRTNPNSSSHTAFTDKYFDVLKVSEEKYSLVEKLYPSFLALAENMKLKARMNLLRLLASRTGGEYKQLEKELITEITRNKRYYQPGIKADDRWMWIITHHLYGLYTYKKRRRKECMYHYINEIKSRRAS